jgi:diacylglycerol kinase
MKALLRSFGYAFRGLYRATRTERNLRIHIVFMLYMYGFLLLPDWFGVTAVQWALLLLANALVVVTELFNTAIEATVDLATQGRYHRLAAVAKDTAAAGVLVCALSAVAVGVAVLWQPEAFRKMGAYYETHPVMIGVLAISVGIAGAFIFSGRPASGKTRVGVTADAPAASIGANHSGPAEPVP